MGTTVVGSGFHHRTGPTGRDPQPLSGGTRPPNRHYRTEAVFGQRAGEYRSEAVFGRRTGEYRSEAVFGQGPGCAARRRPSGKSPEECRSEAAFGQKPSKAPLAGGLSAEPEGQRRAESNRPHAGAGRC